MLYIVLCIFFQVYFISIWSEDIKCYGLVNVCLLTMHFSEYSELVCVLLLLHFAVKIHSQAPNRPTVSTRKPISAASSGEDTRTLHEIVENPALLIRGRPVHMTKILELFRKAGLDSILNVPGPMTVFMPSDDAFAWLSKEAEEKLEKNQTLLLKVLLFHVTQSEILPSSQRESYTIPSLEGKQLVISMLNGGKLIYISGAQAVAVTRGSNGIFYVINRILYPLPQHDIPTAIRSRPDLTTLSYLLSLSGVEYMLGGQAPYTLLAPTDSAFAQFNQSVYDELTRNITALEEILLNHIIEGAHYGHEFAKEVTFPSARGGSLRFQNLSYGYQVNEVNITSREIITGTGVIYLIDQVLLDEADNIFIRNIMNSAAGIAYIEDNDHAPRTKIKQEDSDCNCIFIKRCRVLRYLNNWRTAGETCEFGYGEYRKVCCPLRKARSPKKFSPQITTAPLTVEVIFSTTPSPRPAAEDVAFINTNLINNKGPFLKDIVFAPKIKTRQEDPDCNCILIRRCRVLRYLKNWKTAGETCEFGYGEHRKVCCPGRKGKSSKN